MTWILLFFFHLIFSLKNFFLGSLLEFTWESLFMSCIIPLVVFLILKMPFSLNFSENFFYFFIFSLLYFCFFSFSSLMFLFFFESCALLMILLIFNMSKDWDKISSIFFMFLLNMLGSVPFMYFSSMSIPLDGFPSKLGLNSTFLLFCFILILLSKMPSFFLHFWLTKAHVSANGSSSMILASLLLKVGTMGLFKYSFFFTMLMKGLKNFFFSFSIFCCLILLMVMFRFFDFKYLIACSSIVHMSMIFPSFLIMQPVGIFGGFLMMVGHGLISLFLFFLVTLIYENSFNRSFDFNKSLESLSGVLALSLFFSFLMNMGFPPFMGFFSELLFCSLVTSFSSFCLIFYLIVLMSGAVVFMFFILKVLEGKKNFFLNLNLDSSFSLIILKFSLIFFLLIFFYY